MNLKQMQGWYAVGFLGLIVAMVWACFPGLWQVDRSLEAGDAPMWMSHVVQQALRAGRAAAADPYSGLGSLGPIIVGDWTALCYLLVPVAKAQEAQMVISVVLAALAFWAFLRERGYPGWPAALGAWVFAFSPVVISLAKAGHVGKFLGVVYMALALWSMQRAMLRSSFLWSGLTGYFIGCGLAQSRDHFVILGIGLGGVWIFDLVAQARMARVVPWRRLAMLVCAGVVSLALAWPVFRALRVSGGGDAGVPGGPGESETQRWEWATQWSLPSDELPKLVMPSYAGWDSWHPQAPYWGRMGRTQGWEQHRQGFRNFTQTNEYLGILAVLLALTGVAGFRRFLRAQRAAGRAAPVDDTWFWAVLSVLSLVLAMGKYAPLYRLFYELPMMDQFRNPVKFIHLTVAGLAVLAAQGACVLQVACTSDDQHGRWCRSTVVWVFGVAVVALLTWLISVPWQGVAWVDRMARDGFEKQLAGLQGAMFRGGLRSLLFCLAGLVTAAAFLFRRRLAVRWLPDAVLGGMLLWVSLDYAGVAGHYVAYQDPHVLYRRHAVVDYLLKHPAYRVKFLPHNWSVFNLWNSLHVPYFSIRSTDKPAESRRPADQQAFFDALSRQPLRMLRLLGARHILPQPEHEQMVRQLLQGKGRVAFRFHLTQTPDGAITPVVRTDGAFAMWEFPDALPCGYWYGRAEYMAAADMFTRLADPDFKEEQVLLLEPAAESAGIASHPDGRGKAVLEEYSAYRIRIRSEADAPGWVLINDYHDGAWAATVDGARVPVYRAMGVFRAVAVPAGAHEIRLDFAGSAAPFLLPAGVLALLGLMWAGAGLRRRRGGVERT